MTRESHIWCAVLLYVTVQETSGSASPLESVHSWTLRMSEIHPLDPASLQMKRDCFPFDHIDT